MLQKGQSKWIIEKWKRCIEDDRNGTKENETKTKWWLKKPNLSANSEFRFKKKKLDELLSLKSIPKTWKIEANSADWWNHDLPHNVQ